MRVPERLASVLYAASSLPKGDQLRIAAAHRFDVLRTAAADDTRELARTLRVSTRQVQRLRLAFGVTRLPGGP